MAFLLFEAVPAQRVARAKLRLSVSGQEGSDGGYWPFEVYAVPPRDPAALTWNDSPRHEGDWMGLVDASSLPDAEPRGSYELDVTGHVAKAAAAGSQVAFRVEGLPDRDWTLSLDGAEIAVFDEDPVPDLGPTAPAEAASAGAGLWLRYGEFSGQAEARKLAGVAYEPGGEVLQAAVDELRTYAGAEVPATRNPVPGGVLLGTPDNPAVQDALRQAGREREVRELGAEGYVLTRTADEVLLIASASEVGVLYGVFHLLRLLRLGTEASTLDIAEKPAVQHRLNHHWDNFPSTAARDGWGTIERGYAGHSPWQLDLPLSEVAARYREYGRLNASVGLNGAVLNNPNATTDWIEPQNLPRLAGIADSLRPYGIRLYLALRFDSPMALRELDTADPFDPRVRDWWRRTLDRVHQHIPDLGGVLVKGDSEGEPGPLRYGRTHADGANMFAEILRPHGGIVLWRAFVYGDALEDPDPDRSKQAYELFVPQDGKFAENVILQSKHGPWDFQPREPVTPLFGATPRTNTGIELALSKEYTGHTTHANYPIAEFERIFGFDTRARGRRTTIADVVDGSAFGYTRTLVVAVHNPGTDRNWTRMPTDQANWYGFGRLAWNPRSSARECAAEWARLALGAEAGAAAEIADWLVDTDEVFRRYAQPLGIPFTSSEEYHFKNEPEAWEDSANGATPTGLGYDRTRAGSGYSALYPEPTAGRYERLASTPAELVLFLHHVRYDQILPHTGDTLAQSMYDSTFAGVEGVRGLIGRWERLEGRIDPDVFRAQRWMLRRQLSEAINYRNVLNRYVRTRSGIADKRGRDSALREPPVADVPDQQVRPGAPVSGARGTAPGRAYLLPADLARTGRWEREDRLLLAADGFRGTRAETGEHFDLRAPAEPGEYRLHVVNDQGFASEPSRGVVRVAG